MNTMIDLTGRKFGKLTVLEKAESSHTPNGNTITMWKCKCECGNEVTVASQKLRTGHTTSCGCGRGVKGENLLGQKFGRLTVVEWIPPKERKSQMFAWKCKCDCGSDKVVITATVKLKSGQTKSCGCLKKERIGNLNKKYKCHDKRLYTVYMAMVYRTTKPDDPQYYLYGERGIKTCDEWLNDFDAFAEWAYSTGYDTNAEHGECTLDRIDVNGDYSPQNCRWITNKEQQNNRRDNINITYRGETHTMKEWSDILDIPYKFMAWRMSTSDNKRTMDECIAEYQEYKKEHSN